MKLLSGRCSLEIILLEIGCENLFVDVGRYICCLLSLCRPVCVDGAVYFFGDMAALVIGISQSP